MTKVKLLTKRNRVRAVRVPTVSKTFATAGDWTAGTHQNTTGAAGLLALLAGAPAFSRASIANNPETGAQVPSGTPRYMAGAVKNQQKALQLDVNDRLSLASPITVGQEFTLEVMLKRDNTLPSDWHDVFASAAGTNVHHFIINSTWNPGVFHSGGVVFTYTIPNDAAWHRYSIRFRGGDGNVTGTMDLFVDGVYQESKTLSSIIDFRPYPIANIGNWQSSYGAGFIADARIWNHWRSNFAIGADHNRQLQGVERGLVGYWRMNEGAGTSALDKSYKWDTAAIFNGSATGGISTSLKNLLSSQAASFEDANKGVEGWRGGSLLDRASAAWLADDYVPGSAYLKDRTKNGHHLRLGSTQRAEILDGALLCVPGANGQGASAPDHASLFIPGDLDLVWYGALDKWVPTALETALIDKGANGVNLEYTWAINSAGKMFLLTSADGSTARTSVATANIPGVDGNPLWLRVTRASVSGDVNFYTSTDGVTWTQLGATVAGTAGNTIDGVGALKVGFDYNGWGCAGRVMRAIVRNGINGTTVFDADFTTQPDGMSSFTELTGKVVTVTTQAHADANDPTFLPYKPWGVTHEGSLAFNEASMARVMAAPRANLLSQADIEIIITLQRDSWAVPPATADMLGGWDTSNGQRGAFLYLATGGILRFYWSADGTNLTSLETSIDIGTVLPTNRPIQLRGTLDVDNGAAGRTVKFYWAEVGSTAWTQIGADRIGAGVTSISTSAKNLVWGGQYAGGDQTEMRLYRALIKDGINGPIVADFDVSKIKTGPFHDDKLGNLWCGLGSAQWGDHLKGSAVTTAPNNVAVADNPAVHDITSQTYEVIFCARRDSSVPWSATAIARWGGGSPNSLFSVGFQSGTYPRIDLYRTDSTSDTHYGNAIAGSWFDTQAKWFRVQAQNVGADYTVKMWWSDDPNNWGAPYYSATVVGKQIRRSMPGNVVPTIAAAGPSTFYAVRMYDGDSTAGGARLVLDVRFDKPNRWQAAASRISDDFTAANGTNLAGRTTSFGAGVWSALVGPWTINANKVASTTNGGRYAVVDCANSDGIVSAVVNMGGDSAAVPGLVLRAIDSNNLIHVYISPTQIRLDKLVNGVGTLVASNATGFANNVDHVITARMNGYNIVVSVNGVDYITTTVVENALGTKHGVRTDKTAATFDNFSFGGVATYVDPAGNVWSFNRTSLQQRMQVGAGYLEVFNSGLNETFNTPAAAETQTPGDFDVRARAAFPVLPSSDFFLAQNADNNQNQGFSFSISPSGTLIFRYRDATTFQLRLATAGVAMDATPRWYRVTFDIDNGAGGHDVKFYTSTDGVAWTQVGTTVTNAGIPVLTPATTAPLSVGSYTTAVLGGRAGRVYEAQLWKGIPGFSPTARLVSNPVPSGLTNYAPYKEPSYLAINGTTASDAGTGPDLTVTSDDIDIRAQADVDGLATVVQSFVSRYKNTKENYNFYLHNSQVLRLEWWDGVAAQLVSSTVAAPALKGLWYRVTLDGNNGAGGYTAKFYTSTDGTAWTQLGADVVGGAPTTITFRGTDSFKVGSSGNNQGMPGKHYRGSVRTVIGGASPLISWDFTNVADGAASYTTPEATVLTPNLGRFERRTWSFTRSALLPRAELRTGRYIYLPGVANNYVSLPDSAETSIVGDLDLRGKVFVPSTHAVVGSVMGIWTGGTGGIAWRFNISARTPQFHFSPNNSGSGAILVNATATIPAGDWTGWVRCTVDVDNGAGGWTVTFYLSADGTNWTQLGAPVVTAGTVAIQDSTGPLTVGASDNGTARLWEHRVLAIEMRDGIGGLVTAAWDAADAVIMSSEPYNSFTDLYGNVWTLNRSTTGKKLALVERTILQFATDDYLEVGAHSAFSHTDFSMLVVFRQHALSAARTDFFGSNQANFNAAGYRGIVHNGASYVFLTTDSTPTRIDQQTGAPAAGVLTFLAGTRNDAANEVRGYKNGVLTGTGADARAGTFPTLPMRIGGVGGGGFADMEFVGAFVFAETLSPADVALLSTPNYLDTVLPLLDRSTTNPAHGSGSMVIKSEFGGDIAVTSDSKPCVAGQSVTGLGTFRAGTPNYNNRSHRADLLFFDAVGGYLSTVTGTPTFIGSGGNAQISVTGTAPAGAAYSKLRITILATQAGERFYGDRFSHHIGTDAIFAYPLDSESLEIQWFGTPTDWTPSSSQVLVHRWGITGLDKGWAFYLQSDGKLRLYLSDGASPNSIDSTVAVGATDGTFRGLKVTYRKSDRRVQFFTSTVEGGAWTQLGADVTHATPAVNRNANPQVQIGIQNGGAPYIGTTDHVIVRDGVNTFNIMDVDFAKMPPRSTPITATDGLTYTPALPTHIGMIGGNALNNRHLTFVGDPDWVADGPLLRGFGVVVEEGTTNLIPTQNASDGGEAGTTSGTSTIGSNKITSSTEQAHSGQRSFLCTYINDPRFISFGAYATTAGLTYTVSLWIYIPSDYDGTEMPWLSTESSPAYTTIDGGSLAIRDRWQRIEFRVVATGTTINTWFRCGFGGVPSVGKGFFVDDIQVEQKSYKTSWQPTTAARPAEQLVTPLGAWPQTGAFVAVIDTRKMAANPNFGANRLLQFGSYANANTAHIFQQTDGRLDLYVRDAAGTGWLSTTNVITAAEASEGLHLLVVSWNGVDWKVWWDGALKLTTPGTGIFPVNADITWIGNALGRSVLVDNQAIRRTRPTNADVTAWWNGGALALPGNDADALHYSNLDEALRALLHGEHTTAPINLDIVDEVRSSNITYASTSPAGTTLVVEGKLDNQGAWTALPSGSPMTALIPAGTDVTGRTLQIRSRMTSDDAGVATPTVDDLAFTIYGPAVESTTGLANRVRVLTGNELILV